MNKELLMTLHELPVYQMLLEELKKTRPIVPVYDWKNPASMEEIKFKSSQQQGFDLAMSKLTFNGDQK